VFDPQQPSIAVALVFDSGGNILIGWNAKWRCFTLPMTKIDKELPAETPSEAAVRAAAEVLQVPCRVVAGKEQQFFRGLQKSDRDAEIKDYQYHVVQVEPHPEFSGHVSSALYASADKLRSGEYQPVSGSVGEILNHCIGWG